MSIEQTKEKDNTDDLPVEEEFDIVPVSQGSSASTKKHIFNIAIIVLISSASFGLGRLVSLNEGKMPVEIKMESAESFQIKETKAAQPVSAPSTNSAGSSQASSKKTSVSSQPAAVVTASGSEQVVASRNGSKYHYPWCSGAKQMKEENKVFYDSPEAARSAGLTPAANCKGLR